MPAPLSHIRDTSPLSTLQNTFGSQCQAVHPSQFVLLDRGRKDVADKSALSYKAYRLYSVAQVQGNVQNLLGHV